MPTPRKALTSESPRIHRQTVCSTTMGYGYNVKVTMMLKEDSLKRSPSIIDLCDSIARKQRQLLNSSNKQCHPWSSGSSSVNAFVNSSELPTYSDRDNSSRQTSSSSSTSIALERKGYSRTSQQPANKQTRHKTNGLTHSHDRHPSSDTLPVVYTDENANTTLHALTLGTRQVRTQPSMQPTAINHKTNPTTSSKTQRIDSLSISGIKQDNSSANLRAEETTPEEEDCRPTRLATAERLTPKASPPSLQLYTNTTQQSNGATSQSYSLPTRRKPSKTQHSSGGRSLHGKQKQDPEPKYADPIVGATTSFQARLAELASLEAETVRWERLRKLKKKARDD